MFACKIGAPDLWNPACDFFLGRIRPHCTWMRARPSWGSRSYSWWTSRSLSFLAWWAPARLLWFLGPPSSALSEKVLVPTCSNLSTGGPRCFGVLRLSGFWAFRVGCHLVERLAGELRTAQQRKPKEEQRHFCGPRISTHTVTCFLECACGSTLNPGYQWG